MDKKLELYKAVKHEVKTYLADHGYKLSQMWRLVNEDSDLGRFWRAECLRDYKHHMECKKRDNYI